MRDAQSRLTISFVACVLANSRELTATRRAMLSTLDMTTCAIDSPPNKSLQPTRGIRHVSCMRKSHAGCVRASEPRRYAAHESILEIESPTSEATVLV